MAKDVEGKVQDQSPKPKISLSRQVFDNLLTRILNLEIAPGDILVEASLAEELGTSRAPVREALKTLTSQGFLRVLPRTGYLVIPVTPDDVHEILHMRMLLEGEAAFLATSQASEEEVREIFQDLESRLRELARGDSEGEVPLIELYEENSYFHIGVARASGNSRLEAVIGRLLNEDRRVLLSYQRRPRIDDLASIVIKDHMDLLSALRAGDPERARMAMRQHVEQGRIRLISGEASPQLEIGNPPTEEIE
jgi:DNA-binding GntR family transcriptional regulator